jgi:hypothetical protein
VPQVDGKKFAYTRKGETAAKEYAAKTGKKEKVAKKAKVRHMQGATAGYTPKKRGQPFTTPDHLVSFTMR